ncbi:helix-turn-helix domain-containing protein [Achromobacter sp. SIMBA_011]|jgi:transcriptional regulator GlxA family with amidase domain|uniref:GlxA family transcriptional regulator n=1 Tax=Achromobacter TaxID=222 RepID=UPI0007E03B6E|nr:helix-turn-helix domain-containing protein [Achromobacter dolens]MBQ2649197.1 helix-turn-helix domain-containing protein [Achromobacter sp.]MCZ8409119.1 helix-turn-helix domain-containing protein [Achromobacter dolens]OAS86455.1 AraC family transcriptional regulator [Achromobacter xylosoxidans]CAB3857351.1 HTH-type transcriptional regulator CdhR [Achromobacter dolens]
MLVGMKNIAFLLPAGANIASLETARHGFLVANEYLAAQGRAPQFQVRTLAATRQVSLDDGRITVQADLVLDEARDIDICIAPPLLGAVSDVVLSNRELVDWIARHYRGGGEVASLCLGAALLAAGGLLDGQQAVVHWAARNLYASLFPAVDWSIDRVVHSGNGIYTSGGAFSAAHLVLHLIEKYTDRDTAIWCAKYFQLDWSRQSQLPFSVFMGQKAHADQVVRAVQDFIESRYTEKITVEDLADRHALGRRTLERRFRQATGNSIVEYVQRVRVEAAKRRLESSRKSVSEVMYEVGYNDTKAFRDIFNKYCGMSPVGYRERYQ